MEWWQLQLIGFLTGIISGLAVYLIIKFIIKDTRFPRACYALVAAIIIYVVIIIGFASGLLGLYDKQTYTPPAEIGDIYTVIKRKSSETILVVAEWGNWRKEERINLANYDGLVLCLKHLKQDARSLTVKAKDAIVEIPNQGGPPPEWTSSQYKRVSW